MNLIIPKNYPIYEMGFNDQHPIEQLYVYNYNAISSKYENKSIFYSKEVLNYILDNSFKIISKVNTINRKQSHNTDNILLMNDYKKIILNVYNVDGSYYLEFYYNIQLGLIDEMFDFDAIKKFIITKEKSNINLITSYNGALETQEFDLNVKETDITLNYGESFIKKNNLIISKLNEKNCKGIVLLHGLPGSGKSSYIRYLTTEIKEKQILFIPPAMADSLSDPTIISFLMDYKNSILIIEDGEKVISDRNNNGSSVGVSNILNLTDGILSDCLNIQILVTFNMEKEKIDKALLRKGRLICEHKFDELSIEDSNKLLEHLGKKYITDKKMVLTDIYNIDEESYKEENKETKIGFI
jgi:hypothetical protein